MARHRRYFDNDDQPVLVGDNGFLGVDMRRDPALLEPGVASEAVNKDFRFGEAETRRGFRAAIWGGELGVDFLINFPFDFYSMGFQQNFGSAVFSDPNGNEAGLIAMSSLVYRFAANQALAAIGLPLGVTIDADVRLI